MELSNFKEYKFLRIELQNLKNCITNYLGFVLGGSGLSFVWFNWFNTKNGMSSELVAFTTLIFSIIVSLVLSIIFYKFNSHNRYAGYCKLLNQEQIEIPNVKNSTVKEDEEFDIVSWEICINRLRYSDFEDEPFSNLIQNYKIADVVTQANKDKILYYAGKKNEADKYRFWKGIQLFGELILGRVNTKSWQFPIFVTGVFSVLTGIYLSISLYYYSNVYMFSLNSFQVNLSNIAYFFLFVLLMRAWGTYIGKLHSIMRGGSSVDAYCWKFLPIRCGFIKYKFPGAKYSLITLTDYINETENKK